MQAPRLRSVVQTGHPSTELYACYSSKHSQDLSSTQAASAVGSLLKATELPDSRPSYDPHLSPARRA